MTSDQYHALVATYDDHRIEAAVSRIPMNINRAGKHYQKLVREICESKTKLSA